MAKAKKILCTINIMLRIKSSGKKVNTGICGYNWGIIKMSKTEVHHTSEVKTFSSLPTEQ